MPGNKPRASEDDERELDKTTDQDTEGHTMLLDPSAARELARRREQDVQRATQNRQREKEARRR